MRSKDLQQLFEYYALHKSGDEVEELENKIDNALAVASMIERIVKKNSSYVNFDFGADHKLYIDGCTRYQDDEERQMIKEFFSRESSF